eukprot:NODE_20922_length_776_cov_3.867488.p4 GENE.NODE_20922_length_776_cov_3.867488~~NODE_20922_length_776_cov_3.867488.p4  ORF type:complete len:79 (+),score=5.14 NODE_20922_length_776_cov_3.867488:70-306(+)
MCTRHRSYRKYQPATLIQTHQSSFFFFKQKTAYEVSACLVGSGELGAADGQKARRALSPGREGGAAATATPRRRNGTC